MFAVAGLLWLPMHGFWWAIGWMFATMGVGVFCAAMIAQKWANQAVSLLLFADELIVEEQKTGARQVVPFSAIVAYRIRAYRGAQELYLTQADGRTLRLDAYTWMDHKPTDAGIVQAVGGALQRYRQEQGLPELQRRKTFFERPIAKLIPVLATGGVMYAAWTVFRQEEPHYASLLNVVGSYISFLGIWFVATRPSQSIMK